MTSDLLPTSEVADRIGRTVRQVHHLIETGELTPVMKGKGIRGPMFFDPTDVDALAAELDDLAAVARVSTDEERADNARRHTAARRAMYPEPPAATS